MTQDCEAIQQRLSEMADSGETPTPELHAHLENCAGCARFAALWLAAEPPAELQSRPVADPRLRERILDAASRPTNIVPLPASRPPAWTVWLGRVAACFVLAGLAFWLLDPMSAPVRKPLTVGQKMKREQALLTKAILDGGRRVRGDVLWSMSALDTQDED